MKTYKAQLDSFELTIKSDGTSDVWEKNLVEYEVPFATGPELDSLGIKSHPIRFTAVFINEKYEEHEYFVKHVLQDITNTFIHPAYGPISGCVKTVTVRHNDLKKYAEVDVDFLENSNPETAPLYNPDVKYTIEQDIINTQALQMEHFATEVKSVLGPAASKVLAVALDPNQGILSQIRGVSMSARSYLAKIDTACNVLDAVLINIPNPAESIIAMVEYGTTLPGRVIGSITKAVERYALAATLITDSPVSFVQSFRIGIAGLLQSVSFVKPHVLASIAQVESMFVADLYKKDEEKRNALSRIEGSKIWGADGTMNYVPNTPTVLTINDLESSVAYAREDIQTAIDALRVQFGSPEMVSALGVFAASLLKYVDTIKLNREKIITIELDNEIPVHLLCLRYGLPYMAAERLCAINSFWNPSFCSGMVRIYVR
jgi:hypothetical protein